MSHTSDEDTSVKMSACSLFQLYSRFFFARRSNEVCSKSMRLRVYIGTGTARSTSITRSNLLMCSETSHVWSNVGVYSSKQKESLRNEKTHSEEKYEKYTFPLVKCAQYSLPSWFERSVFSYTFSAFAASPWPLFPRLQR